MRRLLLAFLSALSFSASAQIIVTDATFPDAGDILKYVFDNNPVNINPATPPGGNQLWDFSTLQNSQTAETAYLSASEGVNDGSFPGAELVTIGPTAETYFNVTANKFEALGYFGAAPLDLGLDAVATFSPAIVERRAPLQFFDISQSTSNLTLPFSVADLPDNPFQDAPFTPDSMRVRINTQRLDVVDGWGTCQIPGASYPVLRQKRTEYMTTNVDVYVPPLGWIDISQLGGGYFAGYLGTDTTVTFHFISGTEKEEIAIATMNNAQSAVESVQYKNTTVNVPPVCSITGADNVCNNTPGNIYTAPAGMASYNWSISTIGNSTIQGSTTGQSVLVTAGDYLQNYTVSVTITDANGLTSTCSKQSFIYLSKPPANITVNPNPACFGITLDLSVAAAASSTVAWSGEGVTNSNGNPSTTALPASTGLKTYSVIITTDYGCSNTDDVEVMVQTCNIDFSGKIIFSNNNSLGVNNATVNLTGSATGSDLSDTNGDFFITTSVSSGSFILKPTKTVNKLNGVTAGDVTAIQQHVANIVIITDLYKQVAADVNKTNSINSTDASIISQSLLNNPAALAQFKTSWRFAPTSHVMVTPPWGFPEQRTYTNINTSQTNQNFYGIKTGDVATVFANPANFGAGQPFVLRDNDQLLQAGETLVVEFNADQMDDLAAFQCALRFDPAQLQFVEIQPMTGLPLTPDNIGAYNIAEGEIRLVWAQATGVAVDEAAPVFRLQFTALQSGANLSEVLQLDESELPALSYTGALAESKLELKFSALTGTPPLAGQAGVQLFQNRPNPFSSATTIGFVLPEACEAQLRVFDVSGRLLAERKGQYPAGKNEEIFNLNGATGVLYYELTTPFGVLAKKMVAAKK